MNIFREHSWPLSSGGAGNMGRGAPSEFLGWVPKGALPPGTSSSAYSFPPKGDQEGPRSDSDVGGSQEALWKLFQQETGATSVMGGRVLAADIERMLAPMLQHMRAGEGAATTLIVICGPPAFASSAENMLVDEVDVPRSSLCRLD